MKHTTAQVNSYTNRKAFTLVEIIIVMAIIAVLSAAFITMINPAKQFARARDSQRRSDVTVIAVALEQYYADNNEYPVVNGSDSEEKINDLENQLTGNGGSTDVYLKSFPHDPKDPDMIYCYDYDPDNTGETDPQSFLLCATLEASEEDEVPSNYSEENGSSYKGTKCMPYRDKYYYCVTSQ